MTWLKVCFLATWLREPEQCALVFVVLSISDRFMERQPGTTVLPQDWYGTVLAQ